MEGRETASSPDSTMSIRVVDYMITARCNLHCPFCYGPDPRMKGEMTQEEIQAFIRFIASQGIVSLIIAGGEPLISPYLYLILDLAQGFGIKVALQTNAYIPKTLEPCLPKLTWLAVPLDGISPDTNLKMRTSEVHLKRVLESIALANRFRVQSMKLKIGTVIANANIGELLSLAEIVADIKPDVWKWYQVRPRGQGYYTFNNLYVSANQIREMELIVRDRYPMLPLVVSMLQDTVTAYLIINPDSEMLIPMVDDYLSFGRLIENDLKVNYSTWKSAIAAINVSRHVRNVIQTFPGALSSAYNKIGQFHQL